VSLNTGWTELSTALKTLGEHWEEAKTQWTDQVRQEFEDGFWTHLEGQVRATLRGIERLAPAVIRLRRDCGPETNAYE
jgi:hypothetical protein